MVVAADHMGDPHRDIIGDYGLVIDRGAVAAEDHEVIEIPALETDPAMYGIVPGQLLITHAEADGERLTRGGALGFQLLPRAEAAIGLALGEKPVGIGLVAGQLCALE